MVLDIFKGALGILLLFMLFKGMRFMFPDLFTFERNSMIRCIFYSIWLGITLSLFFPGTFMSYYRPAWLSDWLLAFVVILGQIGLVVVMNRLFKDRLQEGQRDKR